MKIWILMIGCFLLSHATSAQSTWFNEWFRQKSTQRKYLIEQIAALEVYIGYAKKGYSIYKDGLSMIGSIKEGEFNLHNDYFLSLKGINPTVARYGRVADIINLQIGTVRLYKKTMNDLGQGNHIRPDELNYVDRAFNRVLDDCALILEELIWLTTAGKLEMEDGQRLQRLDSLHNEMRSNHEFATKFSKGSTGLKLAREKEIRDIQLGRSLHLN